MNLATLFLALFVPSAADSATPTILDFHSKNCGPCQQMRPEVARLAESRYPVKSIDVDRNGQLAERYEVSEVPTFIIVDSDGEPLARTKGYQPARQLADLYNKVLSQTSNDSDDLPAPSAPRRDGDDLAAPSEENEGRPNPEPWKSVVRIQIDDPHTHKVGFGSGTIIDSNDQEALILTCAHLFSIEHQSKPYKPEQFPLKVVVELFDGNGQGRNKQVLPTGQRYQGKVIDYNFGTDVALVKIRPGRRLPHSQVVPPNWKPAAGMKMTTVGCSEGRDPTAWTTSIVNPGAPGPNAAYRGIECTFAPLQGRSGGGIFTADGYVAGVCDFASPNTRTGLYAHPESVYGILGRNKLAYLYNGSARDTQVADRGREKAPAKKGTDTALARSTAPRNPDATANPKISIPRPELLGVHAPTTAVETVGMAWKPTTTPVSQRRSASQEPRPEFGQGMQPIANSSRRERERVVDQPPAVSMQAPLATEVSDDEEPLPKPRKRSAASPRPAEPASDESIGAWKASSRASTPEIQIPTIRP